MSGGVCVCAIPSLAREKRNNKKTNANRNENIKHNTVAQKQRQPSKNKKQMKQYSVGL